ncbi:hypothetical protein KUCAC02_002928 [Chaenocephalus aceratus]|uniref:Uncharacterized protein n=1 Tax=Chaenocephalus aceratus TaxID=36190 RepID=A0ACB9WJ45_CHAAC|nr:hypothetical protein KUCAC02_002928 [Chaenocephalus aceratus]
MTKGKTKWKVFLEVVSTVQWVASFLFLGVACTLLMFYLMFTSLWPIPTLYFVWQVVDWHTPERGGRKTTFVRNWRVWEHLRDFFPIKLVKTAELNPNKNYIVGIHPHGIMCVGAFTCFSTESCGFKELFPGLTSNLVTLAGVFRLPLFREYAMCIGLLPVSKKSLTHLLTNRGKGNAVVIVIGGAAESLASAPGVNILVMRQRKGFVRVALEFGADLVPVYAFGENDLFKQVILSEGSLGRRLQNCLKRSWVSPRVYLLESTWVSCPTGIPSLLLWEVQSQCRSTSKPPRRRWTTFISFTWRPSPSYSMNTR